MFVAGRQEGSSGQPFENESAAEKTGVGTGWYLHSLEKSAEKTLYESIV